MDNAFGAGKLFGNYEILSEIGRGGMGVVYKAHEQSLQRIVALKVLAPQHTRDPLFTERFLREARLAAQLNHPGIVHILAIGEANGLPFLAMEYVKGQTVAQRLQDQGAFPVGMALDALRQATDALAAAHALGIIHRDIKPSNLMIDAAGRMKIMDFGLAKVPGAGLSLTPSDVVVGTPLYMAPEQVRGKEVDARTDIYALGMTFYEMLTGARPFEFDTPGTLMVKILDEPLPDMRTRNPGIPPSVQRMVSRMTAKDPSARYPDAQSLRAETATALREHAPQLHADRAADAPRFPHAAQPHVAVSSGWRGPWGGQLRRTLSAILAHSLWVTSGGLALLIAVVATVWLCASKTSGNFVEDLGNGQTLDMVLLPAGTFQMGSNVDIPGGRNDDHRPAHRVELDGFWIGKYEVTVGQFKRFVDETRYMSEPELSGKGWGNTEDGMGSWQDGISWRNPGWPQTDEHPVSCVSWLGAMRFCQWLSQKTGRKYTLPTEAQWEYACRAGTTTTYFWGDQMDMNVAQYANIADRSLVRACPKIHWAADWDDGYPFTSPVGRFQPNTWGLFDMLGNAGEWCLDYYAKEYYAVSPLRNPPGSPKSDPYPDNRPRRVNRDGGWHGGVMHCTCIGRGESWDDFAVCGLRVVCLL